MCGSLILFLLTILQLKIVFLTLIRSHELLVLNYKTVILELGDWLSQVLLRGFSLLSTVSIVIHVAKRSHELCNVIIDLDDDFRLLRFILHTFFELLWL